MKRFILLALSLSLLPITLQAEEGFRSIFNGENLQGWTSKPGAWEVREGAIWCTGASIERNWLIWQDGQPGDFILRLEFRWDKGNSGVNIRSIDQGEWQAHGYQVEIARQEVMGLWHHSLLPPEHPKREERHLMATAGQTVHLSKQGKKTVDQESEAESIQALYKEHAWNTMEIIAKGNTLIQKINGVVFATVTDYDEDMATSEGVLALQDHGKGCVVAFRNLRLKPLSGE
jgi:hypothetical protein